MEISRYASKLASSPSVLPSGRPFIQGEAKLGVSPNSSAVPKALSPDQFPRHLPQEPEDARLTGGTRSLSRRLLALNIPMLSVVSKISATGEVASKGSKIRKSLLVEPGLVA